MRYCQKYHEKQSHSFTAFRPNAAFTGTPAEIAISLAPAPGALPWIRFASIQFPNSLKSLRQRKLAKDCGLAAWHITAYQQGPKASSTSRARNSDLFRSDTCRFRVSLRQCEKALQDVSCHPRQSGAPCADSRVGPKNARRRDSRKVLPALCHKFTGTSLGSSLFSSKENMAFLPDSHNRVGESGVSGMRHCKHAADRPRESN
ncbi:MAG: hypothetical protein A4E62_02007 [Syntrophorhabdus sp. PtaU1.Bin002]|nr:MAG: hypothetical protein A4E62_02007 [Syntrophorhabdus sp. PtaU1.Bin002]